MGERSAIEWTDATWNPVTGCSKVSPGCAHCYAETFAERWRGIPGHPYEQGFDLRLWPQRLQVPLRWRKPRMVFVNSMSDLFHEQIPDEYVCQIFEVMGRARQHTFQVLTKRPKRMLDLMPKIEEWVASCVDDDARQNGLGGWPIRNVWLGVSIENRKWVGRADVLRRTPAAVRFISAEPLLGPLVYDGSLNETAADASFTGLPCWSDGHRAPDLDLTGIDWLICGGESGPRCRPMKPEWARDLRDACAAAGTAFFLKQLGGNPHKRGGDLAVLDDRRHIEMPPRRLELPA